MLLILNVLEKQYWSALQLSDGLSCLGNHECPMLWPNEVSPETSRTIKAHIHTRMLDVNIRMVFMVQQVLIMRLNFGTWSAQILSQWCLTLWDNTRRDRDTPYCIPLGRFWKNIGTTSFYLCLGRFWIELIIIIMFFSWRFRPIG